MCLYIACVCGLLEAKPSAKPHTSALFRYICKSMYPISNLLESCRCTEKFTMFLYNEYFMTNQMY